MSIENIASHILLIESYTRQVLPMVKAFHSLGCKVDTLNDTHFDLGNITRFADKKFVVKNVSNDAQILTNTLNALIKSEKYDVIIPLSDFSASVLSSNYEHFRADVSVAVNPPAVFNLAYDKKQTMQLCAEKKIPAPRTAENPADISDIERLGYPIIVKPKSECGSIGIHIFRKSDELKTFLDKEPGSLSTMLFQEYIPQNGKQFNAQAFVDNDGQIRTLIITEKVRWFPLDGGASTMCMEVTEPSVYDTCVKLMQALNWRGYCDIDLIQDTRDGIAKVIEVNARISANVKMCFISGIDVARQILEFCRGDRVTDFTANYKHGMRLRCMHTDIIWFFKSPDRFKRKPSWFNRRHTRDQIFDYSDPIPFITFSFRSLTQYKKAMEKRKR